MAASVACLLFTRQTFILSLIQIQKIIEFGSGRICKVAETMRGARGKNFEWGLMTSPRETFMSFYHRLLSTSSFSSTVPCTIYIPASLLRFGGPSLVGDRGKLPPPCPPSRQTIQTSALRVPHILLDLIQ